LPIPAKQGALFEAFSWFAILLTLCVQYESSLFLQRKHTRGGGGTLSLVFLICICIVEPGRRNSFVHAPRMSLSMNHESEAFCSSSGG